jgi:cytochrome c oxidase subunit 4
MTDHQESHFGTYFTVFLVLCVFTLMSIGADKMHFTNHNITRVLVLAIATAKALCVMMYFMHLKFERAWKYLLLTPTLILALAIPFALFPDVGAHYYTPDVPQLHEYESQQVQQDSGHGGGHAPAEHH